MQSTEINTKQSNKQMQGDHHIITNIYNQIDREQQTIRVYHKVKKDNQNKSYISK